jgi:two-component system sensor histidine kinase VicK
MSVLESKPWLDTDSENTEVLYKFEDILACALDILSRIIKTHDLCLGKCGPSVVLGTELVKNGFISVHNRGAKVRLITEVIAENIDHCKEFMKFAEVRHLDKVKGHFSVSDTKWFTASAVAEKDKPPPRLIYSNVKEIAEQHQYFFETLWNKAIPAEQRIREIEQNLPLEKVWVVYGEENALSDYHVFLSKTTKWLDTCGDSNAPSVDVGVKEYNDALLDCKRKGLRLRYITEITKDNMHYSKELAKIVELRHLDRIKGNFAVTENQYLGVGTIQEAKLVPLFIFSNIKAVVEQHQFLFDTLWNKAVPAEQRIRDIEEERESINLEILSSNRESAARGWKMVENSNNEILVLFPTANIFNAALNAGVVNAYNNAAKRGVTVKILTGIGNNDASSKIIEEAQKKLSLPLIQIRTFWEEEKGGKGIMMAILVVDDQQFITWNIANESTSDIYQIAGTAIYSSNPSAVSSYRSIFNSLWKEVELHEQIKVQEQLQKEFINIAAHELRTPIQPILGMAEILGSQFSEDGKLTKEIGELTRDELAVLVRNAKRLERLSSDVLEIARIESGRLNLNIWEFNLNDVISPLVHDARNEIKSNGKDVKIHYTPSDLAMKGDKDRISEVVWNLLNNAIKFTDEGTISISIKKGDDDNHVTITVKDTGKGIDPQVLPKLFSKFVTNSEKGTGLGLFISKSIVEAHGGKILAENNADGKGSTFAFSLPLIQR